MHSRYTKNGQVGWVVSAVSDAAVTLVRGWGVAKETLVVVDLAGFTQTTEADWARYVATV